MPEFILFWYVGWQVGAENVYIWSLSLRSWLQNTIQGYRGFSIDLQWNTLLVFLTIDNLNTQNPVLLCRCQCGSTKTCKPCWSNSKYTFAVLINISENIFMSNYAKIKVFFIFFVIYVKLLESFRVFFLVVLEPGNLSFIGPGNFVVSCRLHATCIQMFPRPIL